MIRRAPTAALASALAGLAAGCGASHPTAPSGQTVFAQECSVCHTLSGRDEPGKMGGDLLGFHASRTEVLQFVREMPVRHRLTAAQLQAVVSYVMAPTRPRRPG